jgi:hypothetical protein
MLLHYYANLLVRTCSTEDFDDLDELNRHLSLRIHVGSSFLALWEEAGMLGDWRSVLAGLILVR